MNVSKYKDNNFQEMLESFKHLNEKFHGEMRSGLISIVATGLLFLHLELVLDAFSGWTACIHLHQMKQGVDSRYGAMPHANLNLLFK